MRTLNLYTFLFLLFFLTTFIRVLPHGFHPDSLVYMSIASDYALGNASFWHLHFSDTMFNEFYEHPPLGIVTMAIPFYIFGDTTLIDKLYGSFITLLMVYVVFKILTLLYTEKKHDIFILSIVYFLAFPIVGNTIENNLLELPATLFILLSVYIFLDYVTHKKSILLYSFLFSLSLIGAFLVKGVVTLFPLALPFFYAALFHKSYTFKDALLFSFVSALFFVFYALLLYSYTDSYNYFEHYFNNQLLSSIQGLRGDSEHFKITSQLFIDLFSISFISLLIILIARISPKKLTFTNYFYLFFLIGLSGSIPLEVSPKQHDYYVFPALIFFAIALAILFIDAFKDALIKLKAYKILTAVNFLLFVVAVFISYEKLGSVSRYENFYHDIKNSAVQIVPQSQVITCVTTQRDKEIFYGDIGLRANLKRYYNAELTQESTNPEYIITTQASLKECSIETQKYKFIGPKEPLYFLLYKKTSSS
ncbi:MAG: hypothetical protein JXQ67_09490 [Campylobacterales bacterium]|nr:hypothetical protein [Campylobacterales bacterium]